MAFNTVHGVYAYLSLGPWADVPGAHGLEALGPRPVGLGSSTVHLSLEGKMSTLFPLQRALHLYQHLLCLLVFHGSSGSS